MKTLLLIFAFFSCINLFSQTKISYGPELAVNMSGIPQINKHTSEYLYVTETKNLPVISPAIGFFGEIQFGKHVLINSDLSYKKVGFTYNQKKYKTHTPEIFDETSSEQKFNVVSAPLMLGYNFILGSTQFQIKAGYRFNYFFNGKNIEGTTNSDITTETETNPFSPADYFATAPHHNNQGAISIGMHIKEKWNLSLNGSLGADFQYYNIIYDNIISTNYHNLDLALNLKYNLGK